MATPNVRTAIDAMVLAAEQNRIDTAAALHALPEYRAHVKARAVESTAEEVQRGLEYNYTSPLQKAAGHLDPQNREYKPWEAGTTAFGAFAYLHRTIHGQDISGHSQERQDLIKTLRQMYPAESIYEQAEQFINSAVPPLVAGNATHAATFLGSFIYYMTHDFIPTSPAFNNGIYAALGPALRQTVWGLQEASARPGDYEEFANTLRGQLITIHNRDGYERYRDLLRDRFGLPELAEVGLDEHDKIRFGIMQPRRSGRQRLWDAAVGKLRAGGANI